MQVSTWEERGGDISGRSCAILENGCVYVFPFVGDMCVRALWDCGTKSDHGYMIYNG